MLRNLCLLISTGAYRTGLLLHLMSDSFHSYISICTAQSGEEKKNHLAFIQPSFWMKIMKTRILVTVSPNTHLDAGNSI